MQWLELLVSLEAGGDFILASLNGLYLIDFARNARSAARRVGAGALAVVSVGLALEALLFLYQASTPDSVARWAAVLVVRSALLVSSGLISLLLWRSLRARRR